MFAVYLLLSAIGLVGTWAFNVRFDPASGDGGYLAAWFANPASSSAAVDLIVVALAAMVFMLVEGYRLRLRVTWIAVLLTVPVAVAFAFPLFLAFRHRAIARSAASAAAAPTGGPS